jgi:hypothetical protein
MAGSARWNIFRVGRRRFLTGGDLFWLRGCRRPFELTTRKELAHKSMAVSTR